MSYIESIRSGLAEREEKIGTAITVLRRIIRTHATFDSGIEDYLALPQMTWSEQGNESVWIRLLGGDGKDIPETKVKARDNRQLDDAVYTGTMMFYSDAVGEAVAAVTIEIYSPNIFGYDGAPLNSEQIGGAIIDLERYEGLLGPSRNNVS
jgi:hypothetical protein